MTKANWEWLKNRIKDDVIFGRIDCYGDEYDRILEMLVDSKDITYEMILDLMWEVDKVMLAKCKKYTD